jgi:hypothetical protein
VIAFQGRLDRAQVIRNRGRAEQTRLVVEDSFNLF